MARIRSIKPEFWQDERVAGLSIAARLLFIGLWNMADDHGRLRGNPLFVRANVFPYDSAIDVSSLLAELAHSGRIQRYGFDGESYIWIRNFKDHQKIDKPSASKLPDPPEFDEASANPPRSLAEASPRPREEIPQEQGAGSRERNREQGAGTAALPLTEEADSVAYLQKSWNDVAPVELSRWKTVTKDRRTAVKARLKEHSTAEIRSAFERLARSTFLRGGGGKGWKADVDWLLKPGNVAKVLEGKYDDSGPATTRAPEVPCSEPDCDRVASSEFDARPVCESHSYSLMAAWMAAQQRAAP